MPSPPRLRRSPPRRALHERSESQANEGEHPSLRLVEASVTSSLGDNPYPTKPSQVLLPRGQLPTSEARGANSNPRTQDLVAFDQEEEPRKTEYISADQNDVEGDGNTRYPPGDAPFYAPSPERDDMSIPMAKGMEAHIAAERPKSSITTLRNDDYLRTDASAEPHNETTKFGTPTERQPSTKDSENSLSSANTTETVIVRKTRDSKKRASYSAFPHTARPSSSRSNGSSTSSPKSSPAISETKTSPQLSDSPTASHSPTFPSSERRISSAPGERYASYSGEGADRLQYPVIRPPSASSSWAESSTLVPPLPTRAVERAQQRWNPHLSTVQSEGSASMSGDLTGQTMWLPSSSRASQSSSKYTSIRMSSDQPPILSNTSSDQNRLSSLRPSNLSPLPSAPSSLSSSPPVVNQPFSGATVRSVNDKIQAENLRIPPTITGTEASTHSDTSRLREHKQDGLTRPSSRASFFRDSIPAWARTYYARPSSAVSSAGQRDSVATDNISLNVWRPNKADRRFPPQPGRRRSGLAMHPTRPEQLILSDTQGVARRLSPTLSPHLWHDRASLGRRRSLFKAPSIDEAAEGNFLTKRNIQIFSFALGFLLPLSWFVAAFLPLPTKPEPFSEKGKRVSRGSVSALDLEKRSGNGPSEWARYENARWWRNINRIMCLAGIAVLILVIALAVIGAT